MQRKPRPRGAVAAHAAAGAATAIAAFVNPVLAILMFLVFILYEVNEDWHLNDMAYVDILHYAAGLYTVGMLVILWGWLD